MDGNKPLGQDYETLEKRSRIRVMRRGTRMEKDEAFKKRMEHVKSEMLNNKDMDNKMDDESMKKFLNEWDEYARKKREENKTDSLKNHAVQWADETAKKFADHWIEESAKVREQQIKERNKQSEEELRSGLIKMNDTITNLTNDDKTKELFGIRGDKLMRRSEKKSNDIVSDNPNDFKNVSSNITSNETKETTTCNSFDELIEKLPNKFKITDVKFNCHDADEQDELSCDIKCDYWEGEDDEYVNNKYQVLYYDKKKLIDGMVVYRIKALRDIGTEVKKGDLGGFVESEDNLSFIGECWIYDNSVVRDEAKVVDNAQVLGNSIVSDNAIIMDNAIIRGNVFIGGHTVIGGRVTVSRFLEIESMTAFLGDSVINQHNDYVLFKHNRYSGNNLISYCVPSDTWTYRHFGEYKVFSTTEDFITFIKEKDNYIYQDDRDYLYTCISMAQETRGLYYKTKDKKKLTNPVNEGVNRKYKVLYSNRQNFGGSHGPVVYRIQALRDIGDDVKAGDLGGFVESENNLSFIGESWIYDNSTVLGDAFVGDNAKVKDNSSVFGDSHIDGNAVVEKKSTIFGTISLSDNVKVTNGVCLCYYAAFRGDSVIKSYNDILVFRHDEKFSLGLITYCIPSDNWTYKLPYKIAAFKSTEEFVEYINSNSVDRDYLLSCVEMAKKNRKMYYNEDVEADEPKENSFSAEFSHLEEENKNDKYTILYDEPFHFVSDPHRRVYRIKALRDIGTDVKKGDIGGYVEDWGNLSQVGDCWIYDDSCVIEYGVVKDNAKIKGGSLIAGDCTINGSAEIGGGLKLLGRVQVGGNVVIQGLFMINQNTMFLGESKIYSNNDYMLFGHYKDGYSPLISYVPSSDTWCYGVVNNVLVCNTEEFESFILNRFADDEVCQLERGYYLGLINMAKKSHSFKRI